MAKYSRKTVGSVCKNKDTAKPDYITLRGGTAEVLAKALMKLDKDNNLNLNLESKKFQLESLEQAVSAGKLSGENAEKARERINKIPDWVRFEIVLVEKNKE